MGGIIGAKITLGGAAYNLNACITNQEGGNSGDPSEIIGDPSGVNQPAIAYALCVCGFYLEGCDACNCGW